MNEHPDIIDLELYRSDEADADVAAHVASCAACQADVAALSALAAGIFVDATDTAVSPETDVAVLAIIETACKTPRTTPIMLRWAAAAAVIVLCGALYVLSPQNAEAPVDPPVFARQDVNRDGHVDIIDAYRVAAGVKDGSARAGDWDFNADGQISAADAEAIAIGVVALGGGG